MGIVSKIPEYRVQKEDEAEKNVIRIKQDLKEIFFSLFLLVIHRNI